MHLFFLTRGIKHDQDRFIEGLSNMYMPMKLKDNNGKETTKVVQGILQPIQLFSYVFPEENLDQVLRTIKPDNSIGVASSEGSPKRKWCLAGLRKFMGLKKIPKWEEEGNTYPLYRQNIKVTGIGIKKDYRNEYGNECL